ncbi:GNAT family N-acetyltransferase [Gaetbulibacter sp. M235]|uniref:GNAT family N-acetyltransferase n=1 Tax=Gaetbulibacter sp. M235 TaxID=3126510 RepID=UPI00374F25ED
MKTLNDNKNILNVIDNIYISTYIPTFVEITLNKKFKKFSFNRFQGFLINLENFNSIEDYMMAQFGSKSRSKIRSYVKRLETCFNIDYKFYYGSIEKPAYELLFDQLELMIKRRFDQRGDKHQALQDWDYYKKSIYQEILNKNTSLFVIYDNNKPIDICINYHYENIIINSIRAYDIDYSKFKLGYVDIFKQLEWSFENKIKLFDLGPGILTYKKQWCNVVYDFRNYIIFKKTSLTKALFASSLFLFYKLKIFLDRNNIVQDKGNKILDTSNNYAKDNTIEVFQLKTDEIPKNSELENNYTEINFEHEEFMNLRNIIYDYLYLNFEQKNKVKVYKLNDSYNSFIIMGKKPSKFISK